MDDEPNTPKEEVTAGSGLSARLGGDECEWSQDEDGDWETACDEIHVFIEGDPVENNHRFCPYCGKRLRPLWNVREDDDYDRDSDA